MTYEDPVDTQLRAELAFIEGWSTAARAQHPHLPPSAWDDLAEHVHRAKGLAEQWQTGRHGLVLDRARIVKQYLLTVHQHGAACLRCGQADGSLVPVDVIGDMQVFQHEECPRGH